MSGSKNIFKNNEIYISLKKNIEKLVKHWRISREMLRDPKNKERLKELDLVSLKWNNQSGACDSLQTQERLLHKG